VEVRASSGLCTWTAESDAAWIVLGAGVTGKGSAQIPFTVTAAAGPARSGTIQIAGQRFSVSQSVSQSDGCAVTITPASYSAPSSGGRGSITVTTSANCPWTAASNVNWLTLSQSHGTGPGTVSFTVAPSNGAARSGAVVIAGQTFTVTQSSSQQTVCTYDVEPRSHSVAAAGGAISINVATGSACAWSASTPVPWIALSNTGPFAGSGSVSFSVGPATGPARTATVLVADQPVTISQSQACTASISPESQSMPAAGGAGRVTVTAGAGCAWTASSDAPWMQVVSGAAGNGNGEVGFQVAPSNGGTRTGTLTIAGRLFTVTQSAACTFTIAPELRNIEAAGGTFDVAVTTSAGCPWTAASNVPWISARDTGNGKAEIVVAANTGAARTGTVTIAGRTLTVNQGAAAPAPACEYSVRPRDIEIGPSPRFLQIEVRTARGCSWTAVPDVPWITVVWGGSGNGDGDVTILIGANLGDERKGKVTIGTEVVRIEQDDDDDED